MTLAEQNANRLLQQELKWERRSRGERNLSISRRNKIVSLNKPQLVSMDVPSPTTVLSNTPVLCISTANVIDAVSHVDQSAPAVVDPAITKYFLTKQYDESFVRKC